MKPKNQQMVIKVFTFIALVPSFCMFFFSLFFAIPAIFSKFGNDSIDLSLIALISILFGMLGFVAFILQLSIETEKMVKIKSLFLFLSLVGFSTFLTFANGIQGWKKLFYSLQEFDEDTFILYIFLWPIVVSIINLIFNLKLLNKMNND